MLLDRANLKHYWSEIIAAADPQPIRAPRYVAWPSVCDTNRTNWLNSAADLNPPAPLPGAESFSIDVGCHMHTPALAPGVSLPDYLQNVETLCIPLATPAAQAAFAAHTFSHDAVPTQLPPEPRNNLYSTITGAPGLPPPPAPQPHKNPDPDKPSKKRGRPPLFDAIMRARLIAMVQAGCTLRHAARRLGISRGTICYTCRNDSDFADALRRAEQERDVTAVGRIQNAGEKSRRAAAWLLERNAPDHFSFRQQNRDPLKYLGKRRFKQLLAEAIQQVSPKPNQVHEKSSSNGKPSSQPANEEIKAQVKELLGDMDEDERFNLLYDLGY